MKNYKKHPDWKQAQQNVKEANKKAQEMRRKVSALDRKLHELHEDLAAAKEEKVEAGGRAQAGEADRSDVDEAARTIEELEEMIDELEEEFEEHEAAMRLLDNRATLARTRAQETKNAILEEQYNAKLKELAEYVDGARKAAEELGSIGQHFPKGKRPPANIRQPARIAITATNGARLMFAEDLIREATLASGRLSGNPKQAA